MKFYLIEISNTNSGTAAAMTEKTDHTQALMSLHQVFASAMANSNVSSCYCKVIDNAGNNYEEEFWSRDSGEEV